MIQVYRSTSYLTLHGTIQGVPLRKCWLQFYVSGILIIATVLMTEWDNVLSILGHIIFLTGFPVMLFLATIKVYENDPVVVSSVYRHIVTGGIINYEVEPDLFEKKIINNVLEEK
ncbi:hypothetical protein [Chondrinema litorale]|uniref:hypothetical protein n=1 Tax=Chondrinema litorale TaxID=2994555 RepID=UPI0025432CBF|nr:hypothetical protein [Chondrinema litorale]UZR98995.1 hypothetical protein OQ292_33905 [Chondrinema litorale]